MTAFAAPAELETYLGGAGPFDPDRAQLILDGISEEIRGYCRQLIDGVTADDVVLFGSGLEVLALPQIPVTALAAVAVDGTPLVAGTDYRLEPAGVLRRLPARAWWWRGAVWPAGSAVAVTYDHGFDPIPADVRGVCLRAAARAYRNPEALMEQAITNYTVIYGRQPGAGVALDPFDEAKLDRYRVER